MTEKKNPPFRADHVGSLLRPNKIREAFKEFHSGKIDKDEFLELMPTEFDESVDLIWENKITDVKTIIGLLWLQKIRDSL